MSDLSEISKPTLFHCKGACSLAPLIALEEAGAEYEVRTINLAKGEQRNPDFLAINPKGRVPALVVPGQGIITENIAILAYIAQTYPAAELAPTDSFGFARVQAINSFLSSTVHVAHAHFKRPGRWADDEAAQLSMQAKAPHNLKDSFDLIESEFLVGPYVLGESYSIADPYLFTIANWLESDGVDIDTLPKTKAHRELMLSRPAVQRVLTL